MKNINTHGFLTRIYSIYFSSFSQINAQIGITGWWLWTVSWIPGFTYHLTGIYNYHFITAVFHVCLQILHEQIYMKTLFCQKILEIQKSIFLDQDLSQPLKLK